MSTITDVRRVLNARACFALVDLQYALRDGRISPEDITIIGLTPDDIRAGHDCIMEGDIDRHSLDKDVRASVAPLARLADERRDNDPHAAIITDTAGRILLSARHLEMARQGRDPMTESEAKALHRRLASS